MRLLFLLTVLCISCQDNSELTNEIQTLKNEVENLEKQLHANAKDQTAFVHTVYFWFKNDVTESEKKQFADDGLSDLITCKSIYKGYYGLPEKAIRDVVDDSYGYALNCHFKSAEDQEVYQNDPQHLAFIEKYKHLWDKVIVYDNLVAKN